MLNSFRFAVQTLWDWWVSLPEPITVGAGIAAIVTVTVIFFYVFRNQTKEEGNNHV